MKKGLTMPENLEPLADVPSELPTARVNVHVSEAEHQKLKTHAARTKTTIKELIRAYIASLPD